MDRENFAGFGITIEESISKQRAILERLATIKKTFPLGVIVS